METTVDKKKILNFAAHFSEIAKKENWVSNYDVDSDSFAVRVPKLSDDARKQYVGDEFAFYLNHESDVEGVFIEYFLSNFVAHHTDLKDVAKELKREERREDGAVIVLNKNEVKKLVPELQNAIINSIMPSEAGK